MFKWLSAMGAAGSTYLYYWVAAVITTVAIYVSVINIDNKRLTGIVYNYAAKSEQYREHLGDSIAAEDLRAEFVIHVSEVMTIKHEQVERMKKRDRILEHFNTTNEVFNLGVMDVSDGSHD